MKYTIRALLAVGILAGFYLVGLAVVAGLGYLAYLLTTSVARGIAGHFMVVLVVAVLAIGRGIFSRKTRAATDPLGIPVGESEQPELWREVRELADVAGTRAPDEIRLVIEANASVTEEAKLLGLVGGTRRMYLGVPLLIGLTRQQLRSVLAHELGHYSRRDTALAPLTYRGTEAIDRVLTNLEGHYVRVPFELYSRLYRAVSQTLRRRQELLADRLAAEMVGPAVAARALEQTEALSPAWRFFLDDYVLPGEGVGCRPRDLFDGFSRFVADPERRRQIADLRANLEDPPRSVYDGHPPTSRRLAAFHALETAGHPVDDAEPAVVLFRDARSEFARLSEHVYRDTRLRPAEFDEIVPLAFRSSTASNASLLLDAVRTQKFSDATLGGVVSALKDGRAGALLALTADDLDPDTSRHLLARLLGDTIAHTMFEAGLAEYQLNWGGRTRLVAGTGESLDPWSLAHDALVVGAGAAVATLDDWLDQRGVPRDLEMEPIDEGVDGPPPLPTRWLGLLAPVKSNGYWSSEGVLGVADSGLLVCRISFFERLGPAFAAYSGGDSGRAYVKRFADYRPADLLADGRAHHVPWHEIVSITAHNRRLSRSMVVATGDGTTTTLKWPSTAHLDGEIWAALSHYLGQRFSVDP